MILINLKKYFYYFEHRVLQSISIKFTNPHCFLLKTHSTLIGYKIKIISPHPKNSFLHSIMLQNFYIKKVVFKASKLFYAFMRF